MDDAAHISEHAERYRVVAAGFADRLAAVGPEAWDRATPCDGWSVRALVRHSAEVHGRVASLAGADVPELDEAEPAASWRLASRAVLAALDDPERRVAEVPSRAGTVPFEQLVGTLLAADTLIHTWDLARGAGLADTLDVAASEAALAFLAQNEALIRVPGGFGPALQPPPGADVQVRLLCFAGRTVS